MASNSTPDDLLARSLAAVWHPCTQMKQHESFPLVPIARGEGIWLYDPEGRRYLDAISSWWVNLFGHANPRINAALRDQALRYAAEAENIRRRAEKEVNDARAFAISPEGAISLRDPAKLTEVGMAKLGKTLYYLLRHPLF